MKTQYFCKSIDFGEDIQQMLQQQSNGAIHTSAISQPQTQVNNPTIGNLSPPPAYRSHLR